MIGLVIMYSLTLASGEKLNDLFPVVATGLASIQVSAVWDPSHSPDRIRLDFSGQREGSQAWCGLNDNNQWVQISSQIPLRWDHILTQGRGDLDHWVLRFSIEYLSGDDSLQGIKWISYNKGQVFLTNGTRNNPTKHILQVPLYAYAIRIKILAWHGHICMRLEAYVSDDVSPDYMPKMPDVIPAIESGMIVTASSVWQPDCDLSRIRLNFSQVRVGPRCWHAAMQTSNEWVQVSSFKPRRWVQISTQGRGEHEQYLKSYRILYSPDGLTWFYADNGKIFQGNSDHSSIVTNTFDEPFIARIVRLEIVSWNHAICIRMEVYYNEIDDNSTDSKNDSETGPSFGGELP